MKKIAMFFLGAILMISVNAFAKPIVAQFFGIWDQAGEEWDKRFRMDTPFDKLNRLNIAFGKIIKRADGHFAIAFDGEPSRAEALISRMKALNPSAEIFLTVGGDNDKSSYGGAAFDEKFAENVRDFLIRYGFDGFDVDWEQGLEKEALNFLMSHLSKILHQQNLKLTLDVWPYVDTAYDMYVLKENVDQINIMSYGTSIRLSNCAEDYVKAGFPAEKIIGGIETEKTYGEPDTLGTHGTIAEKALYALNNHLAGMMEWRLDADYPLADDPAYPTYQGAKELWSVMNVN